MSGVRTDLEGVRTKRVGQKGLFSPMETLETDVKRGVSGASIQVTTVWSRWHVGDVVDIMCDLTETGVVM